MKEVSVGDVLIAASNLFGTMNIEEEKGDRCGEEVTLETCLSIVMNTCEHEEIKIVNVVEPDYEDRNMT